MVVTLSGSAVAEAEPGLVAAASPEPELAAAPAVAGFWLLSPLVVTVAFDFESPAFVVIAAWFLLRSSNTRWIASRKQRKL